MQNNNKRILTFGQLPAGALFKALKPESVHSYCTRSEKRVDNHGTFIKISDAYSINTINHKDAIFKSTMPCQLVPRPANLDKLLPMLSDWAVVNRGRPAQEMRV